MKPCLQRLRKIDRNLSASWAQGRPRNWLAEQPPTCAWPGLSANANNMAVDAGEIGDRDDLIPEAGRAHHVSDGFGLAHAELEAD